MRRLIGLATGITIIVLAIPALAGKNPPPSSVPNPGQVQSQATPPPAPAKVEDPKVQAQQSLDNDVEKRLAAIRDKGTTLTGAARVTAESTFTAEADRVNVLAKRGGESAMLARLAAEFRTTRKQLTDERATLKVDWGQFLIAQTIAANVKLAVGVPDLFKLRSDGLGWAQITTGLDLRLNEAQNAVRTEGRVAAGLLPADGEVARIHGPGSRIGPGVETTAAE